MIRNSALLLECCVDSVESAINAKSGGADRLELCSNLVIGGTTPTLSLFQEIRKTIDIPIHVLIRPRFGDFLYSPYEINIMANDIDLFRKYGADGIVIGCLTPDGSLALTEMENLLNHAGDMHTTLHRAFDMCKDPFQTLEDAKSLGMQTILTSGQQDSCIDGIDLLNQLDEKSKQTITIMAGSHVNEVSIQVLLQETNLTAFHLSGKKTIESGMKFRNHLVHMGLPGLNEYENQQTESETISIIRNHLDTHDY